MFKNKIKKNSSEPLEKKLLLKRNDYKILHIMTEVRKEINLL